MWNDTDIALAHLITFRCYGTWFHGDKRGSIDRFHKRYKSPYIPENVRWLEHNQRESSHKPVTLDTTQRQIVELAARETCGIRRWALKAINVRTNHVHVVVAIGETPPERALNAFKGNATRKLRENGCWPHSHSPWSDKGSIRHLWNSRSVERAIEYVILGQGGEIPDFSREP